MDSPRQSNRAPAPSSEQALRKEQYNSVCLTELRNLIRKTKKLALEREALKEAKVKPSKMKKIKQALDVKLIRQRALEQKIPELLPEVYEKSLCRLVCETMHVKLPRELRDLIYEYIFDDKWVPVNRHKVKSCVACLYPGSHVHHNAYLDPWSRVPAHLRSAGYLGKTVRAELAATWYRYCTFVSYDDRDLLTDFLRTDAWDVGLQPAELINNVEVHIGDSNLRTVSWDEDSKMSKLEPILHGLRQVKPSTRRDIVLAIRTVKKVTSAIGIPHLRVDLLCDFLNVLPRLIKELATIPMTKQGLQLWVPRGKYAYLLHERLTRQGLQVRDVGGED